MPKKVGAHKPTKIPNLSAWALCSEPSPFLMFQIATEPIMERRLKTKQIQDAIITINHYYRLLIFQINLPITFDSNWCLGDHASFVIIAIQVYPPLNSSSRFSASLSEFNDLFQRKSRLVDKRFSLSFLKFMDRSISNNTKISVILAPENRSPFLKPYIYYRYNLTRLHIKDELFLIYFYGFILKYYTMQKQIY